MADLEGDLEGDFEATALYDRLARARAISNSFANLESVKTMEWSQKVCRGRYFFKNARQNSTDREADQDSVVWN
jgi:hypothetical protein